MDWTGCELVEVIPGKVSGRPLMKGTRIPADFVLDYLEGGDSPEEILVHYPRLTAEVIVGLARFAQTRRAAAA